MDLTETIDYLSEKYDIERSEHARELGRLIAHPRD